MDGLDGIRNGSDKVKVTNATGLTKETPKEEPKAHTAPTKASEPKTETRETPLITRAHTHVQAEESAATRTTQEKKVESSLKALDIRTKGLGNIAAAEREREAIEAGGAAPATKTSYADELKEKVEAYKAIRDAFNKMKSASDDPTKSAAYVKAARIKSEQESISDQETNKANTVTRPELTSWQQRQARIAEMSQRDAIAAVLAHSDRAKDQVKAAAVVTENVFKGSHKVVKALEENAQGLVESYFNQIPYSENASRTIEKLLANDATALGPHAAKIDEKAKIYLERVHDDVAPIGKMFERWHEDLDAIRAKGERLARAPSSAVEPAAMKAVEASTQSFIDGSLNIHNIVKSIGDAKVNTVLVQAEHEYAAASASSAADAARVVIEERARSPVSSFPLPTSARPKSAASHE